MSSWFESNSRKKCCPPRASSLVDPVTRTFTYDATTTPYPTDTIPFDLLPGINQLVVLGDIPAPNTVVYMPSHTALLDLFKNPVEYDQLAIDVSNTGANSIDLTIYKTNGEPTGSPTVAYTQPQRIATVPAASVVRLYLRVINPTPVTGAADVKMLVTLEGGTGSVPTPVIAFNMAALAGAATLLPQQIVQTNPPFQFMFLSGTAAGSVRLPTVPTPTNGPAQLLYPNALTAAPPLVSPLVAGDVFDFVLTSTNQSGYDLEWLTNGITGVTLTGSTFQATGTTFSVTFRFTLAGTAPAFLGTTLSVDLASVASSRVGELVTGQSSPTPTGQFLKCDGAVLTHAAYPSLYNKVGLLPSFNSGNVSNLQRGPHFLDYSPTLDLYVGITTVASGTFMTSTDGYNWNNGNATFVGTPSYITWSPLLAAFIVCTGNETLNVSYDGYTFEAVETNTGVLFSHLSSSATVVCGCGTQALVGGTNRVWTTTDVTLQAWTATDLTGSTAALATTSDVYYAPAQDIFCICVGGLVFQQANALGGAVTARTAVTGGAVGQFASDATNIYAVAVGSAPVQFSADLMATWIATSTTPGGGSRFVGVAVNASSSYAKLVGAIGFKGFATSQVAVAANTTMFTYSVNSNFTNVRQLVSWNPNFASANKYVRTYSGSPAGLARSADFMTWYNPDTSLAGVGTSFNVTAADQRVGAGGLTVVAGTSTTLVYTSPDGITWTAQTSNATAEVINLIYSASLGGFVGATLGGFITSIGAVGTAGITWTLQTAGVPSNIKNVAENGLTGGAALLVAVTSNVTTGNNYMTSVDGVTWTARQLDCGDVLNSVAWNGTVWCATTLASGVWTSTDALTWTFRTGFNRISAQGYAFNLVTALSGGELMLFTGDGSTCARSTDNGVNFSTVALPMGDSLNRGINVVNATNVWICGRGGLATSTDGVAWTSRQTRTDNNTNMFERMFYLNGLYFAPNQYVGCQVSQDQGATWTCPTYAGTGVITATTAFGKILIAGAAPQLYSTDSGVTFTGSSTGWNFDYGTYNNNGTITRYATSPELALVAGVAFNGAVVTSSDGIDWTARFVSGGVGTTISYTDVLWAPAAAPRIATFLGCSATGGQLLRSTDGVAWTAAGMVLSTGQGSQSAMTAICYNSELDLFCVVGQLGFIATSRDSTTWTLQTAPSIGTVGAVASLEAGGFVALVGSSTMLSSLDGTAWTATALPFAFNAGKLEYSATFGGVFIPASTGPVFMFTNDGQNVTIGQGVAPGSSAYNFVYHDPTIDALVAASSDGTAVMPRAYDPLTEFVLPIMPNTWIRAV